MKLNSIIIFALSVILTLPCVARASDTALVTCVGTKIQSQQRLLISPDSSKQQPKANQVTQKLKIVNIMPAFWKFEAIAKSLHSQAKKIAAFRRLVIKPYKIYNIIHEFRQNETDSGIVHYIKWVQPYLPLMRKLSSQVQSEVKPALRRFMKIFPDFNTNAITIYFMPSFKHFNGAAYRLNNGHTAVMFGPDGIAAYVGKKANLAVLVSHELFHAYHRQVTPAIFNQEKLYASLWGEGLAEYVSSRINPEAPKAEVFSSPQLSAANTALVQQIADAFLAVFYSTNHSDHYKFFNVGYNGKLPTRSGYLLGYKVCKRIGRHYTLKQMAHLHCKQLKEMIHSAVEALAQQGK